MHIKIVMAEAKTIFGKRGISTVSFFTLIFDILGECGINTFPSDHSKLAEMEFYLVSDLECDLIVFHPYRTLMELVRDTSESEEYPEEREAGELGAGVDDGPRYWGTGEGKLELSAAGIQNAW